MKSRSEGKRRLPLFRLILVLALCAAVGCAGAYLYQRFMGPTTTYSSRLTEFNLHDIGELATQEGCYTAIQTIQGSRKEFGITFPFTTKSYIYSMDGTVKAGLDFAAIRLEENALTKTLKVSMPPAKLLSIDPDRDSFTVYYESKNMFNALHLEETNAAEKAAEEEIKSKAIQYGILDHAAENARTLVKAMIYQVYDAGEWTVEFETREEE